MTHAPLQRRRSATPGAKSKSGRIPGRLRLSRGPGSGNAPGGAISPQMQARIDQAQHGGGRSLDGSVRHVMEEGLGRPLSDVRVHTSDSARRLSEELGARAFTVGRHVFFNRAQYAPGSLAGRRLLAHELGHTEQQRLGGQPLIQRAMKFELQTRNEIWRTKGTRDGQPEKLPRKFGPFLHKAARPSDAARKKKGKEGSGMELQSETGGVLEFETPKWFRKWCALKERMESAVAMTQAMNSAQKTPSGRQEFPFDTSHLRLKHGEQLEVKIVDSSWKAAIQSSESIKLTEYESLLREHELPKYVAPVLKSAQNVLTALNEPEKVQASPNLASFLQIIVNYIKRGRSVNLRKKDLPAKAAFFLMSRTNFHSMYRSLLDPKTEQKLFQKIVTRQLLLKELGLTTSSPFFAGGGGFTQFVGKKRIHRPGPTVHAWLFSILWGRKRGGGHEARDLLSHPQGGSQAMGRFNVTTTPGDKDTNLVKFEVRGTVAHGGRVQPASKWVAYAEDLFRTAATARARQDAAGKPTKDGTELKYDPNKCK